MNGILGSHDHFIEFEVFDGPATPNSLLFDSNDSSDLEIKTHSYTKTEKLKIQGRVWTLFFSANPQTQDKTSLPNMVALSGFIIDLLLFYLITALVGTQRKAEALARLKTTELKQKSLDLAQTNQNLALSNANLARSNEDLAQFAEVASHDLQEPLRTVTSFSQLLEMELGESVQGEGREYLRYIVEGAARMRQLIQDTLTFSTLGQADIELTTVDCQALVHAVLDSHHDLISRNQVEIEVGELPSLVTSPMLSQVFSNLIGNGITYRAESGGRVEVTAERCETHWTFCVSDDGLGVEPEFRERIFQLFQRLHSKEEYSGSGLGLAVCHRVITTLGGKIWVEANQPRGSRFLFTLPLRNSSLRQVSPDVTKPVP